MRMEFNVNLSLGSILQGLELPGGRIEARVETNLVYMKPLVDGHSPQAPAGWLEENINNAEQRLAVTASRAVDEIARGAGTPRSELDGAVNDAALFLLRDTVADTPIDTGRARSSWEITLADGSRHSAASLGLTAEVSEGEQRHIQAERRRRP